MPCHLILRFARRSALLGAALAALFLGSIVLVRAASPGVTPTAPSTMVPALPAVICFGDSITAGTGAAPDTRWEAVLQTLGAGQIQTLNEGVGGRTLADAISPRRAGRYANGLQEALPTDGTPTLVQDVLSRHPEAGTILVFLGVNDLKNNRTDGADKAALALARAATLLDQIKIVRPQIKVVLCCPANINPKTVNDVNRGKKYDEQTAKWIKTLAVTLAVLATQKQVAFCNLEPVVSPENYVDGLHPNPAGHAQIAAAVWAVLRPTLSTADQSELTIGPTYTDAPELTVADGTPRGTIYDFTMNSADSKSYPGIAKTQPGTVPYARKVAVYVPQQYVPGTPAPFLVAQDGLGYRATLPPTLDNLIHQRRLPVMIAIMINSGGGDAQGSERGLEYDTVSDTYAKFIETEVLPKITADYHVAFTKDPNGRATMGGSSGGAAAFTMAWFRPDLYTRVLTYSGTYVNQQSPVNPASPDGAWEYHEHLIPQTPAKPLRVWLEVGENDNGSTRDEASLHNWVLANQHMAAALKAKGYAYRYVFARGAGHTDRRVTRQTLPSALEWLWQGYPVK